MDNKREGGRGGYKVGKGKPPQETRWKKGRSGNPKDKARRPASDAELIERQFRRVSTVIAGGEPVRKSDFQIIYDQLYAKESKGDRHAARIRDRYEKFALARENLNAILLQHVGSDLTRQFAELAKTGEGARQSGLGSGQSSVPGDLASIDCGVSEAGADKAPKP